MVPTTRNTKPKAEKEQEEERPQRRNCRDSGAHEEKKYRPLINSTGSSSKVQAEGSKSFEEDLLGSKKWKAEEDQEEERHQEGDGVDSGSHEKIYRPLIKSTGSSYNVQAEGSKSYDEDLLAIKKWKAVEDQEEGPLKRDCGDSGAHEEKKYRPLIKSTGSSSKVQAEGSKSYEEDLLAIKKRKVAEDQEEERHQERDGVDSGSHEEKKYRPLVKSTGSSSKVQAEGSQSYDYMKDIAWSTTPIHSESSSEPRTASIDHVIKVQLTEEEFTAKYEEFSTLLGQGSYGDVFAGVRLSDSKPVAIKHASKKKEVEYINVTCNNRNYQRVFEVILMAQAAGRLHRGSEKNSGVIDLLDVYDLNDEVRIVMERPLECMDMEKFLNLRKSEIPEHEAKNIIKQLVDTAELMHRNGVFHRDLKGENILLSQDQGDFSVRVIDFGCGDFVQDEPYKSFSGTLAYAPPEVFLEQGSYEAEPTTVWQIGAMLRNFYEDGYFSLKNYMTTSHPHFSHLSTECNNFMDQCLSVRPKDRPTLNELQRHPWLQRELRLKVFLEKLEKLDYKKL